MAKVYRLRTYCMGCQKEHTERGTYEEVVIGAQIAMRVGGSPYAIVEDEAYAMELGALYAEKEVQ